MTLHTLAAPVLSEAPKGLVAALETHATQEALAAFTNAAALTGDLVDNSLPHLQELVRLAIIHLALKRPGVDNGGELERLADGTATDEDMDVLNEDETREILRYVLDGDWDLPGSLALAANIYLENNPSPDAGIIDSALGEMASFLENHTSVTPAAAPVREIVLLHAEPAGELAAA